ncbi:MAG: TfoX/Sxy family protein [Bacteroidetes bacterium]|nr:TfoX/Sxy family protein [Bacteroidota bacterium]
MAYNQTLEELIRGMLKQKKQLTVEKKMFGGIAFMLHNKLACGIVKDELMVRCVLSKYDESLQQPNAAEMNFTGRVMKGFVMVDEGGWRNAWQLSQWLDLGIEFAESDEGKKKLVKKKSKK